MTPTQGEHAQTAAQVQRYKIGYPTDSWGERSSTPSGIPDHAGAWVRYEDHAAQVAALTAAQEMPKCEFLAHGCDTPSYCQSVQRCTARDEKRTTPAQPAAPQGVAYAELPEFKMGRGYIERSIGGVAYREGWVDALEALRASHGQAPAGATFQQRVQPWLLECFGAEIAADRVERNHRFLEESLELVQALGCTASEAHQLVDYVFGRPVGDPPQEVGGVMVTLAALCLASGLDMHDAGEVELGRISAPELVAKIRAKQAAKPKHSPLPQSAAPQADSQPALAVKPACWIPPECDGEYHRPGESITAYREPMEGWEPVYRAAHSQGGV